MKTKIKIGTIPLILMGIILLLASSCQKKKEEESSEIKDKDGNIYTSVTIGTQVWMVENLKTTKYNDGTDIPIETDNTKWSKLKTPAHCWYKNNEAEYKTPHGALYNWYAVNTGKLCPAGWHVPTSADWATLINNVGGINVAGGELKETGTTHWDSPNTGATNKVGFTAIPGGARNFYGQFWGIRTVSIWWSATPTSIATALFYRIDYNYGVAFMEGYDEMVGFSVRCVKD